MTTKADCPSCDGLGAMLGRFLAHLNQWETKVCGVCRGAGQIPKWIADQIPKRHDA